MNSAPARDRVCAVTVIPPYGEVRVCTALACAR